MAEPQLERAPVTFASSTATTAMVMIGAFLQPASVAPPPPEFRTEVLSTTWTKVTQLARENREAPWQEFLDEATAPKGPFSSKQTRSARAAWRRLSGALGEILPLPATRPTAEGMLMHWATSKGTADVVVTDDGAYSWFARERTSGSFVGSDEDASLKLPDEFVDALRKLLA